MRVVIVRESYGHFRRNFPPGAFAAPPALLYEGNWAESSVLR
jgi:hypothetical protein